MYETPWHERIVHFENARAYEHLREFDHLTYLLTETNSGLTDKKLDSYLDETSVENVILRLEEKIWQHHLSALAKSEKKLGLAELQKRAYIAGNEFSEQDLSRFQTLEDAFQKLRQSRVLWRSSERIIVPVRSLSHQLIFELFYTNTRLDHSFLEIYFEWIRGFITGHFSKQQLHFKFTPFSDRTRIEVTFAQ